MGTEISGPKLTDFLRFARWHNCYGNSQIVRRKKCFHPNTSIINKCFMTCRFQMVVLGYVKVQVYFGIYVTFYRNWSLVFLNIISEFEKSVTYMSFSFPSFIVYKGNLGGIFNFFKYWFILDLCYILHKDVITCLFNFNANVLSM
jgi:hypothetical protein